MERSNGKFLYCQKQTVFPILYSTPEAYKTVQLLLVLKGEQYDDTGKTCSAIPQKYL